MPRDTLLDFFHDFSRTPGVFLVYDDGFRTRTWTYGEVAAAAERLAVRLARHGVGRGDKVVVWGENRPEWVVAFWGCLLRGAVVVPIDYRASADFLVRVRAIVEARVVLVGDEVRLPEPSDSTIAAWPLERLGEMAPGEQSDVPTATAIPAAAPARDDVVEIIFTSGATAEPKGVIITHRNILANIVPIEREVQKYKRYARPFSPIRFLNLLPLSHMFGQAMATFVPPMLGGQVVFMRSLNPADIVGQIRSRRVSVLVCVPKILDVLRDHVRRRFPASAEPHPGPMHWTKRWWRYRDVHRAFGWKFWAAVVGAAPLDAALEEHWSRLGFLVIQGYGLTETAPIVTLNHPFSTRKGSVGKPMAGVEVKIAPDGEILVRGDNVSTGYYGAPEATAQAFEAGWLHTGDIGGLDEQGRVYIRGRKKEMIVTPEGLNVFPEDVERALLAVEGVRDAAVVGRAWQGEERVHAVLILDGGVETDAIVREANLALGDHQKIRSASIWSGADLPRTEGTRKLKRREVRQWVEAGGEPRAGDASAGDDRSVAGVVRRFAKGRDRVTAATTIDELGLSSLERVELLMALEEQARTTLDESAFASARTVGDLERLVAQLPDFVKSNRGLSPNSTPQAQIGDSPRSGAAAAGLGTVPSDGPVRFPTWNRRWPARVIRGVSLPTWILPIARVFAWIEVQGLEHLRDLAGPVVFAANHQSHLDTPAVLWALPGRWRRRLAVAMAKEFFRAHFFPDQFSRRARVTSSLNYSLASLFFNAFPLPQREVGTRQTLRYIGALLEEGYSVLIFPEGKRTEAGEINHFRPGIGMIGARLRVPVVPVRLVGLDRVLHQSWKMARAGPVQVVFGPPLQLEGDDYPALAKEVEEAVRLLVH